MSTSDAGLTQAAHVPATLGDRLIGAILVEAGRLKSEDIERVLRAQREQGLRFGETAVRLGLITQDDVEFALARQFGFPHAAPGGAVVSGELAAAYAPFGPKVEALRAVRNKLAQCWFDHPQRKALAIVSASRHEGRSFVAANLAVVFSQSGRRTLLIDGDLRNPMLHRLFDLPNGPGLSETLSGRGGSEVVKAIDWLPHLYVLPAGTSPPNPADLLARPPFARLLAEAAASHDCIIVDTPAASNCADAQTVAAATRGALVVARKNTSRVAQMRGLANSMTDVGASVLGAVLNEY